MRRCDICNCTRCELAEVFAQYTDKEVSFQESTSFDQRCGVLVSLWDSDFAPKIRHRLREQDAQLSQRDRAAGCVIVLAKSRRCYG